MKLHKKAHLLSLEQRWEKQLSSLMYNFSKQENDKDLLGNKSIVIIENLCLKLKQEQSFINSHFYRGTILWNKLPIELQCCDNIVMFKTQLFKQYKVFKG